MGQRLSLCLFSRIKVGGRNQDEGRWMKEEQSDLPSSIGFRELQIFYSLPARGLARVAPVK
jgi:hypothetical protein